MTIADGWSAAFADYKPLPGVPDEFIGADGEPKPQWLQWMQRVSARDIDRSLAVAERHIRDLGISYRVRGEAKERTWPLSRLPLLIDEDEWADISASIVQRASLFEALLRDVYGEAFLVADGLLPAAVVAGSKEFLRPMVGVKPPGGRWMHLYAADIGRGPDGRWWVLNDRAQAPSGAGYALENRLAMSRAYPSTYAQMNVQRLAPFFRAFRNGLTAMAERSQPRICLMTPGPYSETYFEQSYLANYLGFLLVEGDDLVVHDGQVHVRTIAGLKRADVMWRRVDADFVDPIELNGASRLGVPRLLVGDPRRQHRRRQHAGRGLHRVARAARLHAGGLPASARRRSCDAQHRDLVVRTGRRARRRCWTTSRRCRSRAPSASGCRASRPSSTCCRRCCLPADAQRLRAAIEARGVDYVGQEIVRLSTTPVWEQGRLQPRPFVLRVFAAATPDGWQVMPGGFCLISEKADARAVSMGEGVKSADVWVLSEKPVVLETLLPAQEEVSIRRILGNLPSRAADNLFWYGRYLERAEAVLRIVRCLCGRSVELDLMGADGLEALRRLSRLLVAWGATPADKGDADILQHRAAMRSAPRTHYGSALANVRMAYGAASGDPRAPVGRQLQADRRPRPAAERAGDGKLAGTAEAFEIADRALVSLAAISGLAQENVNRVAGWRFLDIGRRIERAINTCRFARNFAGEKATADDLDVLLDLIDSQITYRSRYLTGVALAPVRDMVLLDPFNPRSASFQIEQIRGHLETLPTLNEDGIPEEPKRIIELVGGEIASTAARDIDGSTILAFEQKLMKFADALASRYFLQRPDGLKTKSVSGLA